MYSTEIVLNEKDLISEYNHVHHAKIVSLLEEGRLSLLSFIKLPLEVLVEQDLFLVITGLKVRFLREIKAGTILVTCEEIKIDSRKIQMSQRIVLAESSKVAVQAEIELMIIDGKSGKAIQIPEFLGEALLSLI